MKRIADLLRTTKNWMLGHKLRAAILALALVFTAPWPAKAQFGLDPCCALLVAGLSTIQSALTKVVGGGLNQILGVDQAMQQFQQAVVWPQNLINQARNLVGVLQGNFNQIQNLMHIRVNSATLPISQQLEQVLLSRDPNQIAQTSGAYTALYGPVPAPTAASPQVLNMVDMTDAAAQAAMKRAIEIDALADLELQAANQLNQSIQAAAPGSAPIIEAQADAWLIRANAYLILPFTYTLFTLFYALYGSILYVVGPFVLALMPSRGLGQLGRTYFVNMMVFQCWGLLYAIFQALMSALQITNPMQFNGSFLQAFVGSSQMIVMSVACVLLSIMVALIPFIASRIVRGDIGSTLMTVISGAMTAGAVASGLAFSGGGGLAAGRQAPSGGPPSPPSGGSAAVSQGSGVGGQGSGGIGQVQSSGGGAVTGDSRPPTPPSSDGVNATMSSASGAPSTGATPSVPQNRNDSPAVAAQSASGYNGRSLAGFAAWQAGHAIGRTMRWAGMGAER